MRRPSPRPISAALASLTTALAPQSILGRAQARWEAAVGESIAAAAWPVSEHDGVLTVRCESAVWAQELDLMAPELLVRLNAALGGRDLRGLRCRTS
jgi:predicted nucleic acid-binding Zn ribbon protein